MRADSSRPRGPSTCSPIPGPRRGHPTPSSASSSRHDSPASLASTAGVRSFGPWCLRQRCSLERRAALLEANLERAITRYRPAVVVLAIRRRTAVEQRLLDVAMAACRRVSTRIVISPADGGLRALGWRRDCRLDDAIHRLVRHFVPELAREPRPSGRVLLSSCWRYRRAAWQAAALALRELARTRPWSAVALVRDRPPRCPLLDELARAVLVTDPDTV